MVLVVKNLPASGGDIRDVGSVSGSGRSPGVGNGNPLQYSCLSRQELHGQRSLVGYSQWTHEESDTTECVSHTHTHTNTDTHSPPNSPPIQAAV